MFNILLSGSKPKQLNRAEIEGQLIKQLLQQLQQARQWECNVDYPTTEYYNPETGICEHRRSHLTKFTITLHL